MNKFGPVHLGQIDLSGLLALRRHLARVARLAVPLLIIITSLVVFVPFSPSFPADYLDSGWAFALNVAAAKKMAFGRDIVFTFGPYASIYTRQYFPATDARMMWGSGVLALAFAAALLSLTKGSSRLIALGLAIFLVTKMQDTQFLCIPFISLLLICQITLPPNNPSRIALNSQVICSLALLVVALGLLLLVKGSFALGAGLVMALGIILLILRGERTLAIGGAALFITALLAFWILAGQPLSCLPKYFLTIGPVISGYAAAMSEAGPDWQIEVFLGCSLVIGILAAVSMRRDCAACVFLLAGSAGILFLSFKEGFVRDDGHSMIAGGMLGAAGWIIILARKDYLSLISFIIALGGWVAIGSLYDGGISAMLGRGEISKPLELAVQDISGPFVLAYDGMVIQLTAPDDLHRQFEGALSRIRAAEPIPALSGTADDYSYDQSILLANGLDWDPRPLIQSYVAFTPELEQLDATHLAGANAPVNVLFDIEPIDLRLPALEDGASWPLLLSRYEITGIHDGIAFLKLSQRSNVASPIAAVPSFSGTFRLGQQIELPKNTLAIWAKINVRPTLLGRAFASLFKPPHLNISYTFPDGTTQSFRYIAGMGLSGFVAAPLVQSTADFLGLALPDAADYFAAGRPASFSITAGHGKGWLWDPSFQASFFAMTIPVQPVASTIVFRPFTSQLCVGALPILPGGAVVQRFKPPPEKFNGISMRFVTWGLSPSKYTVEWRVDASSNGQTIELGDGKLDAAAITDWEQIDLPLTLEPKNFPDQITLTFWGNGKTAPAAPVGVPIYRPLSGDTDPPAETDGIASINRAQIGLTPYLNQ